MNLARSIILNFMVSVLLEFWSSIALYFFETIPLDSFGDGTILLDFLGTMLLAFGFALGVERLRREC